MRDEPQGQLAQRWGLEGEVQEQQCAAVREPATGEQLARYQAARESTNVGGETVRSMEHRAGLKAIDGSRKRVRRFAGWGGSS